MILFENFVSAYASEEWVLLIKNYLTTKTFKKNTRIFNEGDPVTGIYFINSGKVKVTSRYSFENERIVRLSKKGTLLGHRAFYNSTYTISGIALTDVVVTFIPRDIFIKFLRANPDFSLFLLEFMAKDLHDSEERMKSMIHHEVIVRIGKIIFMLIEAYGYDSENPKKLHYTLSRSDMANLAGTTYETTIRNLSKLEELKLIILDNKSIIIPNDKALHKFISSANLKAN